MKEKLGYMTVIVSILMLSSIVAPVFANTNCINQQPKVDLTGVWVFTETLEGTPYVNTMIISSFDPCTGVFSGTGYANFDPTLTWNITGTETGSNIAINVLVTGTPLTGVTFVGTGSLSSSTTMGGTGTQSNVGAASWSATRANLVVNISWLVLNDLDWRWTTGAWALDSGMMAVQVWQLPDQSWVAIKTYNGMFYTPKDALSPNSGPAISSGAIVEPKDGVGTMNAQYVVSFTGVLATGLKLTGCLGLKNYGGTIADILTPKYSTLPPNYYNWMSSYFPSGATNVIYRSDYWKYTLLFDKTAPAKSLVETNRLQHSNPALYATPTAVGDIITSTHGASSIYNVPIYFQASADNGAWTTFATTTINGNGYESVKYSANTNSGWDQFQAVAGTP